MSTVNHKTYNQSVRPVYDSYDARNERMMAAIHERTRRTFSSSSTHGYEENRNQITLLQSVYLNNFTIAASENQDEQRHAQFTSQPPINQDVRHLTAETGKLNSSTSPFLLQVADFAMVEAPLSLLHHLDVD